MQAARILIVEDEALIADHLELILREKGYEISGVCAEGTAALDILSQGNTDLVLLDIILKGPLDGIDTAHSIRHKYRLPFIYLTSSTGESTIERVKHTQPEGFIRKPFNEKDLLTQLDIIIHRLRNTPAGKQDTAHESIYVKDRHAWIKIRLADIRYIKAEDNYTLLSTGTQRHIVNRNLKSVEENLPAERFIRVHRSYIINTDYITQVLPASVRIGDEDIPVGATMRNELLKYINTL